MTTLPEDVEPFPLVSSEADGLPTWARLTERRFSTTKPAGTSNAQTVFYNSGTTFIGDFDMDGNVDAADSSVVFGNWGMVDRLYSEGEASGDDIIDAADAGVIFGNWTSDPSPAVSGTASAEYNPVTGEISVSVNGVVNWYVEHVGQSSMTGPDDAASVLPQAGGLITDNDIRIGETTFSEFSYDVDLGAVAATGIANDGSLKIFWNSGLGSMAEMALVSFAIVPEPTTLVMSMLSLASLSMIRRRRAA